MATPFSRFCGGCTFLAVGHFVVSVYALVRYLTSDYYPLAAAAIAGYIVAERAQSKARTSAIQLVQATLCVTAAVDSARCCTALIWFELFAAVIHLAIAMAIYELQRVSDCRRCMNEAHRCECGTRKDAVPPGALVHLAGLIETHWIPKNEREIEREKLIH
jgi:hypothetical protein